jgi:phosphatidylglycerophosphate synthase
MLTIARIILTFVVVYLIFTEANTLTVFIVFAIAAITDLLDGQLARRFNWVSEFGRKADMIADRFLWVGTALAFVIAYGLDYRLSYYHGIQLMFIMSRELVSAPFALIAFFSGKPVPQAVYIAKLTTFLQAFALPALILSIEYPTFIYLSAPLSLVIAYTGTKSALTYIEDLKKADKKSNN